MTDALIENCKTAQLHLGDSVQDYGALLIVSRESGCVSACSGNLQQVMGRDAQEVIGLGAAAVLNPEVLQLLLESSGPFPRRLCEHWQLAGRQLMVAVSAEERQILVELVPGRDSFSLDINERIRFLEVVSGLDDVQAVAEHLLDHIATITGFGRVMLYKFLPEWHGKVLAERLHPGMTGFLNQHFPAGDIPENARRLYTINLQRYIADVEGGLSPLIGIPTGQRLDLAWSQLRSVHPVHIQYLRNIGVRSSFSVSILASGRLWGMIAGHHAQPRPLTFNQRFMCEELSRIASLRISALLLVDAERRRGRLRLALAQVEARINDHAYPEHTLQESLGTLREIFAADSILLTSGSKRVAQGDLTPGPETTALYEWFATQPADEVWCRDAVPAELAQHETLVRHASGMLHVPLGSARHVVLLRNEQRENLEWAGRPPHHDHPDNELSPRASFERWVEQTQGQALRWSSEELDAAQHLSQTIGTCFDKVQLRKIALEDSLTGLHNRRHFEHELEVILGLHKKRHVDFALYMMDLDRFKQVNDTLGHAAGDELLVQVARRLKALLRSKDTIARLGGDEFALIQYNTGNVEAVELVARRILLELHKPYMLEAGTAEIGVSIGIALHPQHGNSAAELMEKADKMLYAVKNSGRNGWRVWCE